MAADVENGGIFAEAKSFHGLRRARYRGRAKVQIQVYMISTVQNLKRLATAVIFIIKSIVQVFRETLKIGFFPQTWATNPVLNSNKQGFFNRPISLVDKVAIGK